MMKVMRCLSLLTQVARVDIIFDKGIDTWEPVILSDQFDCSRNAAMSSKGSIMMFPQDIHAQ